METIKTPKMQDIPQDLFTRAEFHEELSEDTGFSNYSYWRSTFRTFFKSTLVKVIIAVMVVLIAYTVIYPMVTDRDPYEVSLSASDWNLPPSAEHPFGTDGVGRDIWARVWLARVPPSCSPSQLHSSGWPRRDHRRNLGFLSQAGYADVRYL